MSSGTLAASLIIVLASGIDSALTQPKSPADSVSRRFTVGATQMTAGYVQFDFGDLDSRMAAAGLPRATSAAATIGFGGDVRKGRLLIGAGYQSLLTRNNANALYRTRISGSYGLVDVAYAVVGGRQLTVYPVVGVGATHLSINVKERGDFDFDDGLQRPGREISLSGIAPLVHTGILIERRIDRRGSEYSVSLRGGITRNIGTQSWASADNKVTDGPGGIRGSYVRLAVSKPIGRRRDSVLPIAGALVQTVVR
jgi:hypothetical protein